MVSLWGRMRREIKYGRLFEVKNFKRYSCAYMHLDVYSFYVRKIWTKMLNSLKMPSVVIFIMIYTDAH